MRHGVLLLLAVGLLACSEADPIQPPPEEEQTPEPRPAAVHEMRVIKVRGDQESRVPPPESGAGGIRALVTATVGADGYTSEPLVARIAIVQPGGMQALQADGDSVYVPKGTLVHWHLSDGCGRLFAQTTATDDSAYVVNRWAPGTRAGACTATAGRLVGTEIVTDTTWTLVVLPGPPTRVSFYWARYDREILSAGDTIDLRELVRHGIDAYGNEVPRDSLLAWPDSAIGWAWSSRVCQAGGGCAPLPTEPTDRGWMVIVPPIDDGARLADGTDAFWLTVWFPIDEPKRMAITVYDLDEIQGNPGN